MNEHLHFPVKTHDFQDEAYPILIGLIFDLGSAFAQPKQQATPLNFPGQLPLKLDGHKPVWMLTYFRQRYPTRIELDAQGNTVEIPLADPMLINKLHMALSTDGRHWTPLNDNKPIWEQHVRDPFVRRGPDGLWRMLSTGGGNGKDRQQLGPSCQYMTSNDLIHWQLAGTLPLMKDVRDETGALVRNIWAPEWFYDPKTAEYVLIWSSSFRDAGWKESRLWSCRTLDWKTFTPARVFFAPAYSVIDGTLLVHKGTYYLFHKEEESEPEPVSEGPSG